MIEEPKYYKTTGSGKLFAGRYKFDVTFQVYLINEDSVIYCKLMDADPIFDIIDYSHDWSIKGYTDKKESFFATNLRITEINNKFIELISWNNIIIGDYFDFAANKAEYPLANLYDTNFSFSFQDFAINVSSEVRSIKKNISKYWGIPQVSGKLVLEKPNEPIESIAEMAKYITKLISLGSGRHINLNFRTFFFGNKKYSLISNNYASSNYISSILYECDLPDLIKTGVPILQKWDKEKYKDFRIILDYINSSDSGYVDDRVLKLIQCYEVIIHNWLSSSYELPEERKALKRELKKSIKEWKKVYPDCDLKGFWSNRIHSSLEWDKTIKLIEDIIKSQNLDIDKLELNITKLVELRHAVAHRGRFGSVNAIQDLINGQFALRLFLLKTFGYNGRIKDYRELGTIAKSKNIKEFETASA